MQKTEGKIALKNQSSKIDHFQINEAIFVHTGKLKVFCPQCNVCMIKKVENNSSNSFQNSSYKSKCTFEPFDVISW